MNQTRKFLSILFIVLLSSCTREELIKVNKGIAYYRLKQVDYNGSFAYFNIIQSKQESNKRAAHEDYDWKKQNIDINNFTETNSIEISHKFTLNITDTLIVKGDFKLKNDVNINISSKGCLIIIGDYNSTNKSNLVNNGSIYCVGEFKTGNKDTIKNNNKIYLCQIERLGNKSIIKTNQPIYQVDLVTKKYSLTCSGLPIILKSFTVTRKDNNAHISFTTTSETNSDYIEIQKSYNLKNWITITTLKSTNTNNETTYNYTDSLKIDKL